MWPTVCLTMLAGWSCLLLPVVSTQSEITLFKKEGDEVVLKPQSSVNKPITSIVWKDGSNLAIQWEQTDPDITYFRHFRERCSLNTSSGEVTITGVTRDYNAVYTPSINEVQGTQIVLRVMSPVPVPTVTESCDDKMTSCTLTCDGNITGVEEVTYEWKSDESKLEISSKEHKVEKEKSQTMKELSCEMHNPVSRESSKPIPNPFIKKPKRGLNVNSGLIVFICLLTAVIMLAIVHRCKAGMWFFQKESLPHEADFWRKKERPRGNECRI
ncbi:T-lymphocyte surface antigen Ly-9-like [Seriola dumerili]|uniref:T-lymphocyte surface antigen Ly-9-like n=1 Tax=Seriola dumerili TaxID=41447 RepID=A0A3B4TJQ6_SERDU|nr:T-lymphocyte surface antigen Ly-9-like [Seriola dumerili]